MADNAHRPIVWSTLEEYEGDADALARQGGGDWNSKPKGFAEQLENLPLPEVQLRRRTFLKLGGFAAVLAAASGCEKPIENIMPYIAQPEQVIPGVANYYASTCQGCSAGCGILVKTREARPIKLEGNPKHPVNNGKMCARGQAQLMDLYDPDRVRGPIGAGGKKVAWDVADDEIAGAVGRAGNRAVLLTRTIHGRGRLALIERLRETFPGLRHVMYDVLANDLEQSAPKPRYHFDRSQVTVLLGGDPIAEGASPVEFNRAIGHSRTPKQSANGDHSTYEMARVWAFEPTMTTTGINADHRFSVKPSDLLDISLALATELGVSGLPQVDPASLDGRIKLLASGTTEEVPFSSVIAALADDLRSHQGRSLVYGDGMMARTEDALELQAVVQRINSHLGNIGGPIDYSRPSMQARGSSAEMAGLLEDMRSGNVDVLLVEGANPVYSMPAEANVAEAMAKVKLKVSFSTHRDETAALCDVILPGLHFLENWGDSEPYAGIVGLQQPTIGQLWDNRAFEQSLIAIARAGGSRAFDVEVPQPARIEGQPAPEAVPPRAMTWHEFLQNSWREQVFANGSFAGSFEDFWFAALRGGVLELRGPSRVDSPWYPMGRLANYQPRKTTAGQLELATYAMNNMYDGRHANNPWLMELPDPVTKVCWDNYVAVSPVLAKAQKLKDGLYVELAVGDQKVEGPIRVVPGMHPEVVAIGTGWGRWSGGGVMINGDDAEERPEGFNALSVGRVKDGRVVASGMPVTITKTGKSTELADVMGHNYMRRDPDDLDEAPRQLIQATSLEKLNHANNAPQPLYHIPYWENGEAYPDMWRTKDFHYDKHKWVMSIDLNSCTGCNACMIACQAENNVPVVGKREVLIGREMHWIRIDRYYKGHPLNPEVTKQPMLCQHCDNAPCETVCPVIATAHTSDGINMQVYNRCVGTRYCSNNCPYKVRRFNFYHYTKFRKGPHDELGGDSDNNLPDTPLALALNPDVTVRSKGVMEKCNFCIQRLHDAKREAKQHGRNIPETAAQVACQQTCPTDAIVFGDRLNPSHSVNRIYDEEYLKRGYGVLAEFNVKPNIMYLAQIMNRDSRPFDVDYNELHGHGEESHGAEYEGQHDDPGHPQHQPSQEPTDERHEHEHPAVPGQDEVEVEGQISLLNRVINSTGVVKS